MPRAEGAKACYASPKACYASPKAKRDKVREMRVSLAPHLSRKKRAKVHKKAKRDKVTQALAPKVQKAQAKRQDKVIIPKKILNRLK